MDSLQLNELANKIRAAGGKPSQPAHPSVKPRQKKVIYKPSLGNVHLAVQYGHINLEEAQDLNPKYDPSRKKFNSTQASKEKRFDRDPEYRQKWSDYNNEKQKAKRVAIKGEDT
jgi:hypothetical protein